MNRHLISSAEIEKMAVRIRNDWTNNPLLAKANADVMKVRNLLRGCSTKELADWAGPMTQLTNALTRLDSTRLRETGFLRYVIASLLFVLALRQKTINRSVSRSTYLQKISLPELLTVFDWLISFCAKRPQLRTHHAAMQSTRRYLETGQFDFSRPVLALKSLRQQLSAGIDPKPDLEIYLAGSASLILESMLAAHAQASLKSASPLDRDEQSDGSTSATVNMSAEEANADTMIGSTKPKPAATRDSSGAFTEDDIASVLGSDD